ncbi:MerR family transcriptional regulator [Aminobacter aminovorans]|uniref:DNA-binding transcriptional MerR regulator n=1 Tax=Aminobacter aminovorans TaxID=83263 RepID=A0AAC8YJY6_AMIAI|nr:MerR family transcriptional regulator [Aminobacter aminovorans]AMS39504.1 hypothetical protein AA2016_0565 [Aminobacter aminovorans]MBB3707651.1 DNA-binding transcriptional MerR regulator [Aminobacter aminovorans]
MDDRIYTIGELSRLSGITVRKLRFYSDRGLLPPTVRAESGYRMYSGVDLERLGLILALRDAGVSLADIGKILSNRLAISAVLELRLQALEAESSPSAVSPPPSGRPSGFPTRQQTTSGEYGP